MPTQHSKLKKLTVAQPFKKSPVIYANIRFVTPYTQQPDQSNPQPPFAFQSWFNIRV
jgi:hypothetical protein